MPLPDQRRYDRKHMNNHAQQFAFLQCVHNFPEGTLFVQVVFRHFFRICLSDLPVNNRQII